MKESNQRGMTIGLLSTILLGGVLLASSIFFYELQVTTQATGIVEASEATTVYAPRAARVAEVWVSAGDAVEPGQLLMVLEDPDLETRIFEVEQAIDGHVHDIEQAELRLRELAVTGGIPGSFEAERSQALQQEIEAAYAEIGEIYQGAFESGGVSRLKAMEQTIEALRVRLDGLAQESVLYQQQMGLPEVFTDRERVRIRFAEQQIERLNRRLGMLREEQAQLHLTSPMGGVVTDVYVTHRFAPVSGGEALLGIANPEGGFEVEAFIPDRNIDLVHAGLNVRLESHVYQSSSEGYMTGVVKRVIRDAYQVSPDTKAQFEVEVAIESYPVEPVIGSKVDMEIVLHDVAPLDILSRKSVRTGEAAQ